MKRTTNFTGELSSASNSIPLVDLPKAATTSSSRSEEQCGMAIPNPIPVLIVSSRCRSAVRMGSRSAGFILPRRTSKSINSTMAAQRSVAFISGMICSAESKLAKDMRVPGAGGQLSGGVWVDKRVLGERWHVARSVRHFAGQLLRKAHPTRIDSQHHPNRVHGNRRQHVGGSGQNARAPHSFLFANFIVQPPRQQPAHAEHIDCRAKSAITQTVFALAEATGPMVHWNLHKPVAGAFDQRGNETVHSLEWNEGADTLSPHRLECATSVAHP